MLNVRRVARTATAAFIVSVLTLGLWGTAVSQAPADAPTAGASIVTLSPAAPLPGDEVFVFVDGLPGDGLMRLELHRLGAGQVKGDAGESSGAALSTETVEDATTFAPSRGFGVVRLPYEPGRYLVRVVRDAAPDDELARAGPFEVAAPDLSLDVAPVVRPLERTDVRWGGRAATGDRLRFVALEPSAFAPTGRETDIAGMRSLQLEAPAEPGEYEARIVSADGAIRSTATFTVEAPAGNVDAAAACPEADQEAALREAFDQAVDGFLAQARLVYGRDYDGLTYDVTVRSIQMGGSSATVEADYRGSATHAPTGETVRADGSVQAWFRLDGCSWNLDGFVY